LSNKNVYAIAIYAFSWRADADEGQ
jgi:hypothetical protein